MPDAKGQALSPHGCRGNSHETCLPGQRSGSQGPPAGSKQTYRRHKKDGLQPSKERLSLTMTVSPTGPTPSEVSRKRPNNESFKVAF